jgi:hypothetical protein
MVQSDDQQTTRLHIIKACKAASDLALPSLILRLLKILQVTVAMTTIGLLRVLFHLSSLWPMSKIPNSLVASWSSCVIVISNIHVQHNDCRSQWPRGLRRGSAAASTVTNPAGGMEVSFL